MKTKVTVGNTIFSSKAETWEENSNQEKTKITQKEWKKGG